MNKCTTSVENISAACFIGGGGGTYGTKDCVWTDYTDLAALPFPEKKAGIGSSSGSSTDANGNTSCDEDGCRTVDED